jgi:glycosyltransferase involved in cell wall biosynthesis
MRDMTQSSDCVWLANLLTHYHRTRADAFAKIWPGRFTVLELSNRDELPVLQSHTPGLASVQTLFPGKSMGVVGKAVLRKAITEYLETARPGVCCLNGWALPGTAVMLDWAVAHGVPCVVMSESNEPDRKRYWIAERMKAQFVRQCSAALVGGAWSRNYLIELGMAPDAIFDGYDAVDNEHFRAGAEMARQNPQHFRAQLDLPEEYFFACARFEPKKNFHRLIEAYALYACAAGEGAWKLVIAGDGPSRPELEAHARSLGVEEGIVFAGLMTYQDLPGVYGLAKAFVHASTTEQWGLVVNEAMAAGLPVLVSERCGCTAELVRGGENGYTFNPWDVKQIAEKMLAIHKDAERRERMGQRSTEIIAAWGPERFARNLKRAVEYALDRGAHNAEVVSRTVVRLMAMR